MSTLIQPSSVPKKYDIYKISKGNGKFRTICAPNEKLKQFQSLVGNHLTQTYPLPPCVKGFVPHESIYTNALCHLNKKLIINIDIKDFFGTIPSKWLKAFCKEILQGNPPFKTSPDVLYDLITLNNKLPQGSPCSPVLANLYAYRSGLDESIEYNLLNTYGIKGTYSYTRYADDITISTNDALTLKEVEMVIIPLIYQTIYAHKLEPNTKKTKIVFDSQQQRVTGIVVNNKDPKVSKKFKSKVRAAIFQNMKDYGDLTDEVSGMLSFIKQIDKNQYSKLMKEITKWK